MKCKYNNYLPDVVKDVGEFKDTHKSIQIEICGVEQVFEDIKDQFVFETMTWGIDQLEAEFGIDNSDLPKHQRIEILKARFRGRGTTTIDMIKSTAEAFSGAEVEIVELYDKYKLTVKFVGTVGIPENLEDFKRTLDLILPAHLAYELEYTYVVWGMLKQKTWGDLKDFTWKEVLYNQGLGVYPNE